MERSVWSPAARSPLREPSERSWTHSWGPSGRLLTPEAPQGREREGEIAWLLSSSQLSSVEPG